MRGGASRLWPRWLVWAAVLWSLVSCQMPVASPPQSEEEIRRLLVGTWHVTVVEGRSAILSEKEFFADGTARGYVIFRTEEAGVSTYLPRINFTSRWELEGNRVVIHEMRDDGPGILDPAEVDHDRILSITRERMRYRDEDGRVWVYERGPLD